MEVKKNVDKLNETVLIQLANMIEDKHQAAFWSLSYEEPEKFLKHLKDLHYAIEESGMGETSRKEEHTLL